MKEKSKKKEKKSTKKILAIGTVEGINKVVCPECNVFATRGTIVAVSRETGELKLEPGWQCPTCGMVFKEEE